MADYKELLRRAISALPENNGAARRAVYEKARSALVGQLRAIQPPLPAREITQHRLQLEDCIRQVEQEASEAVITLGRDMAFPSRISPAPVPRQAAPEPAPIAPPEPEPAEQAELAQGFAPAPELEPDAPEPEDSVSVFEPEPQPEPRQTQPLGQMSIEDIITHAAAASGSNVEPVVQPEAAASQIVDRVEAQKSGPTSPVFLPPRSTALEPRRDTLPMAIEPATDPAGAVRVASPIVGQIGTLPRSNGVEAAPVQTALSSVREVDVEAAPDATSEAEGAISRAIETLDRAARGEATETVPEGTAAEENSFAIPKTVGDAEDGFAEPAAPSRSGSELTIFLIVFAVLLAGVGGAGFWAWREGYIDLDQMFAQGQPAAVQTAEQPAPEIPAPTLDPAPADPGPADDPGGPGNTATNTGTQPSSQLQGLESEDRLEPTAEPVTPNGTETALPDISTEADKTEERLPGSDAPEAVAANDPAASVDPAVLSGSQSLLLEASGEGRTGAVPFSGTVEWSEGVDDLGAPTLVGQANIPARNLGINITIRKNMDPSLPASHLMEVDFDISDTFIGGSIASLPGVLLKDRELVPGTPLVGASARVVGNSFLFALSASASDAETNTSLLENRKWMDLAVVYGNGRNAIVTLEKDDEAQALFETVFERWAQ